MQRKPLIIVLIILFVVTTFHPGRHARYYDYIAVLDVLNELVPVQNQKTHTNLNVCPKSVYQRILMSKYETNTVEEFQTHTVIKPLLGGEYTPSACTPRFKTAIIVPYRDRAEHLKIFLHYMHVFLQKQFIHYRIFIVEQNNTFPFNRALLLNVGAQAAIDLNFPCLILHDVDLIPVNSNNLYTCAKRPRHMSSSINTFRYNLPYLGIIGGATAINSNDFLKVNGMSNLYEGWGAEDDDFFGRLESYNLLPYRFSPEISTYIMLVHKKEKPSENRHGMLKNSLQRQKVDGLSSIPNFIVREELLYTHVVT